ncbi:hypothetical protein PG984_012852 [Apiospora sp. TS-2023a]
MENDRKTAVHKEKEDAITPAPTATHSLAQEKEAGEPKIAQIVNYFKEGQSITVEQHQRIATYYGQRAEANHIAPSADVEYVLNQILGEPAEAGMTAPITEEDCTFELKTEAAIYYHHSPYPEVRSVAIPGDDPSTPVETVRAYFLGMSFMAGVTAVNTLFSPRQPAIVIWAVIMQLFIAPCGLFLARVLPDWGVTIRGTRHSLNPGPWSFKEQVFCSIIFAIANNAGNIYYVYLVQRLPQYLGNTWVTFGYEIVLALSVNFFGMGFAGLLRHFVIYPISCLFPEVFPALALNRALVETKMKKCENLNGWTISRYRFFLACAVLMFFYFWIPNTFFKSLRSFNWMTWIAPQNFTLAMVTGFWGGMGYNPLATLDWNAAGKSSLTTPFFSFAQQYSARFVSGLIIIGIIRERWQEIQCHQGYRPGWQRQQGRLPRVRPTLLLRRQRVSERRNIRVVPVSVLQRVDPTLGHAESVRGRGVARPDVTPREKSVCDSYDDPFSRHMRAYSEVPDWWFLGVLAASLALGIAALEVWPVHVPWWSLLAVAAVSAVMLVPVTLLRASAHVKIGLNVLFQLLGGLWFPGNPEALIIVTAFGQNFDEQAADYITGQKMGHYAKIPPRAVFRGQMLAVLINTFVFVGMLDWMVANFNNGTLCQWNNVQHFVCTNAVLVYASAIEYGAFGVRNMFELYPILPWCFLMGGIFGIIWGLARRYGLVVHAWVRRRTSSERRFATYEKFFFKPVSYLWYFDPAIALRGALNWTGGSNLSYVTNVMYISFIMIYYVKQHYRAWWEKYTYLIEAGFGAGLALSAIIQTFSLAFTNTEILPWWGNEVTTAGVDYLAYNQNASLLPVPAQGFFGPSPDQYPMKFRGGDA